MRAESLAQVTPLYAMIIRGARLKPEYETFDCIRDRLTILDVHNSLIMYVKEVLPIRDPDCLMVNGMCPLNVLVVRNEIYSLLFFSF